MSKAQWGHGFFKGQEDALLRLGLTKGQITKAQYLRGRKDRGENHFDSYDCDKDELRREIEHLGLDVDSVISGVPPEVNA